MVRDWADFSAAFAVNEVHVGELGFANPRVTGWSIQGSHQNRVCFRWHGKDSGDVEIVDLH
jgi:plasmid maintenance system killer protein